MKPKTINITLIITCTIAYFGFCAGIWHVAYWGTFGINYLQYIEITDIIKDFSLPFFSKAGIDIVWFVTLVIPFFIVLSGSSILRALERKVYRLTRTSYFDFFILPFTLASGFTFAYFYSLIWFNLIVVALIALKLERIYGLLNNKRFRFIRLIFIIAFMEFPLWAYVSHKNDAVCVYENTEYDLVKDIVLKNNNDSISNQYIGTKLIGVSREKIFLTDHTNKIKTVLQFEDVESIVYTHVVYQTKTNRYYKDL